MLALYGPLLRNRTFNLVVSGINRCGMAVLAAGRSWLAAGEPLLIGRLLGPPPCATPAPLPSFSQKR